MKVDGAIAAANLNIGRYIARSTAGYLVMDLMQGVLNLRDVVSFDPTHLGPAVDKPNHRSARRSLRRSTSFNPTSSSSFNGE
jgi:hypothetical protein